MTIKQRWQDPEYREKMLKRIPWNRGRKGLQPNHNVSGLGKNIDFKKRGKSISKSMTGMKRPNEYREKRAELMKQKWTDEEYRASQIEAQTGKKLSEAHRRKLSILQRGEKSHFWKGGVSLINRSERENFMGTVDYKIWREAVFARDSYACVDCGDDKGGNLEADHIKPYSLYPELRLAIDNGRTLCKLCHRKTDTWGYRVQNMNRNGGLA